MKRVAIVGYAQTRDLAPFSSSEYEIWGLNDLYRFIPRWDRWFNMHDEETGLTGHTPFAELVKEYAKWDAPVYMIDKHPDVPNSVKFPLEEIRKLYGDYFTNSISYMIAMAIYENFDEIAIYGVDMADGTEYANQRPSCEYWMGVARGKGIKIYTPVETSLLKTRYLYGYENHKDEAYRSKINSMIEFMESQQKQVEAQKREAEKVYWQYSGGIETLKKVKNTWKN